jgi:hypothetical protein
MSVFDFFRKKVNPIKQDKKSFYTDSKIKIICFFCILMSACFQKQQNVNSKYKIGDRGPGGGIIFVVNGSRFSECSEDLGRSNWNEAVRLAKNYNGGGFTDWNLPSGVELKLLYTNLKKNNLERFYDGYYWSRLTDNPTDTAWCINFLDGTDVYGRKEASAGVRAIRTFKEK